MQSTAAAPAPTGYLRDSRAPRHSLLIAVPLVILYELLAASLPSGADGAMRNGADVALRSAFAAVAGPRGAALFGLVVAAGCLAIALLDARRAGRPRAGVLLGMLAESTAYAAVLGIVVGVVTRQLLDPLGALSAAAPAPPAVLAQGSPVESLSLSARLALSLGAGLYEELLFRVLLVGCLAWAARSVGGASRLTAGAFATVVGALLFSAIHYVGPYGDPFALESFTFRFVAGLAFSALYVTRGFGITAWTHALYDVIVLVL